MLVFDSLHCYGYHQYRVRESINSSNYGSACTVIFDFGSLADRTGIVVVVLTAGYFVVDIAGVHCSSVEILGVA